MEISDSLCWVFKACVLRSRSVSRHELGYKQGTLYDSMATKLGNNLEGHEMYPAITRDRQRDLFKKLLYFGSKQIVKLMGELKMCSNWRKSE